MKKLLSALLCVLLVGSTTACSTGASQGASGDQAAGNATKATVSLWASGSDNVRTIFEKLTSSFNSNKTYNKGKYQMKLIFTPSGGGGMTMRDRMIAAYKAGQKNTDYDVVEMTGDDLTVIAAANVLTKIDPAKVPNMKGVNVRPAKFAEYAVPYRGTTVVMDYNSEVVKNPPKTWEDLAIWIQQHPGRFAYNTPDTGGAGSAFAQTAVYNNLPKEAYMSEDSKWENQWDFTYLKKIHPYLYKSSGKIVYPNKNQGTLDLLANKEIDMCPAWADQTLTGIQNSTLPSSIKMFEPTPSLTGSLCSFGVPSIGSHPDGAYAFMNFMLSTTAQNKLVSDMQAIPLVKMNTLNQTTISSIKSLDVSKFRFSSIGTLSTDFNKKWYATIPVLG